MPLESIRAGPASALRGAHPVATAVWLACAGVAVASAALPAQEAPAAGPAGASASAPASAHGASVGTPSPAGPEWFPARPAFDPLLAAPREVGLRGAFLAADREEAPGDFAGTNLEAAVALGHRLPVVRLQRADAGRPELVVGFEVGVFTRFFMETSEKDLIAADFRVGAPVSVGWGAWRARLAVRHVSSHFGDDFVNRFAPPARQTTRDGVELLVARRLGAGLRAYAGGEWNFHVNEGVERTAARLGAEWDPAPADGAGARPRAAGGLEAWPFAAADARVTSLTGDVAGSATGGLALRVEGVVVRLEARAHLGPTPLGQLRTRGETSAGLGLRIEP